jgi:hypothetical protein
VLCSSEDHLETRMRDLDHPVLAGVENTDTVDVDVNVLTDTHQFLPISA